VKGNLKKAEELFRVFPFAKELHFASDGLAFFEMNDARSHATALKDREIETIKSENCGK
jgi:hypothetical protein